MRKRIDKVITLLIEINEKLRTIGVALGEWEAMQERMHSADMLYVQERDEAIARRHDEAKAAYEANRREANARDDRAMQILVDTARMVQQRHETDTEKDSDVCPACNGNGCEHCDARKTDTRGSVTNGE